MFPGKQRDPKRTNNCQRRAGFGYSNYNANACYQFFNF
ncbi:hypothetical protein UCMB321_5666 [Pseudomonas batumici]|uniref:Uncharacterized protein n=1 Tax=Pseudomonas batumici TaxID=226910 RepID=A0A0C2I625_9PSED|nr:hypothetical protein UCMB321_5666 [Pseudomonas batumici]